MPACQVRTVAGVIALTDSAPSAGRMRESSSHL
jgi:hypothetical protein